MDNPKGRPDRQLVLENERLKKKNARLRHLERQFRTTLYAIGDAVIATDSEGRIQQMNAVAEALTGWSEREATGRPADEVFRIFNEHTGESVASPIERVLKEGRVVGLANHTVLHARDGRVVPIADSGAPICEEDGKVRGVVLVFRDQTRERQAEQAVREAEERFRTFFDNAPIGKCMTAPDGRLMRVNPAFGQMLGYSHEEMGRINFAEITHPDDLAMSRECVRCLLAGEQDTWDMEKRYFASNGDIVWTRVVTKLQRDADGNPQHFLTHVHDITANKKAQEDLTRSEEDYQVLFEAMPIAWAEHEMLFDEAGNPQDYIFLSANAAFERFTGLKRSQILGRRVTEAIPGIRDADPDLISLYGEVTLSGVNKRYEFFFAPLDRWYLATVFRRSPGRFVVMFEDVTERKQAEQARDALNKDLLRSNRELEQFAYVASHDLQEPLRMVASFTQLLEQRYSDKLDDRARKYIGFAVDGAKRMQGLVNDLLSFSRVGRSGDRMAPTDCNEVVAEVVQGLHQMVEEAGAEIVVGKLPTVMADRTGLKQLFLNLVTNAIKFRGEEPPRVEISARRNDCWEFCVADNGIGIEPQFHERIFVIFQRLHERDRYPGTGIGLSVVKKIVELHGGTIRVESTVGQGSRFHFTLPAEESEGEEHDG